MMIPTQISGAKFVQEQLPPLDKIFNMVMQEKQHKKMMVRRDDWVETAAAFALIHGERT